MLQKLKSAGAIQTPRQLVDAKVRIQGWIGQGITPDVLATAIELARAARITAGSDQPINVAYVGAKLDSAMRSSPPINLQGNAGPSAQPGPGKAVSTDAERASILGHYARLVDFGQLTRDAAAAAAAAELAALDARKQGVAA